MKYSCLVYAACFALVLGKSNENCNANLVIELIPWTNTHWAIVKMQIPYCKKMDFILKYLGYFQIHYVWLQM